MNHDLRANAGQDFTEAVKDGGICLFLDGEVKKLRFVPPFWRAEVHDDLDVYLVWVSVDTRRRAREVANEIVGFDCDCPANAGSAPCEHLWALLIEVDLLREARRTFGPDRKLLRLDRDGALVGWKGVRTRRQAVAKLPPESITAHTRFDHDDFESIELQVSTAESAGAEAVRPARLPDESSPPAPAPADWRERANRIQARIPLDGPPSLWHAAGLAPTEVRWSLDPRFLKFGDARLTPIFRERRSSDGEFGAFRSIRPDEAVRKPLAAADRQMLTDHGFDAAGPPPAPFGRSRDVRLEISPSREQMVQIAKDGRLVVGDRHDEPLQWQAQPWGFSAACAPVHGSDELLEIRFRLAAVDETGTERQVEIDQDVVVFDQGLALHGEVLAPLPDGVKAAPLQEHARGGPFRIRRDEAVEFRTAFGRALGTIDIEGLETGELPTPVPSIDIAAPDPRSQTIPCTVWFDYDGLRADPADMSPFLVSRGRAAARNLEFERAGLERFRQAGGWYEVRMVGGVPRIHREAFLDVVRALTADGWSVRASGKPLRAGRSASLRLSSNVEWFRVDGEVEFGDRRVALPEILARLDSNRGMVRLDDGSLGMLPENWLAGWLRALEHGKADGGALRFPAAQALWLDALLAEREGVAIDRDAAVTRRRERLQEFEAVRPAKAPSGFQGELRSYQRAGLGWLKFLDQFDFHGCLADDMGLGKTVQLLAWLQSRRRAEDCEGPALVVAPRSVVGNWCEEAARFTPKLRVLDWSGPDRWEALGEQALDAADLVVTTYGVMRRDAPQWLEKRFDAAILDEAQAIKNPQSQTAKAARLLNARRRLALTGTPIENHLGELWSLFQFLEPGMLGSQARFQQLLQADAAGEDPIGERLRRTLKPFLLRRTKEAVLDDLPEKSEQVLHCRLTGRQAKEYEQARRYFEASLGRKLDDEGLEDARFHVLEALLRLRQLACHVGLVDEEQHSTASAKFETLLPMLEEVVEGGHKALVFSQFTSLLGLLRGELGQRGLEHLYLDGRTRKRAALVQRFQEEADPKLFLISLKAGGSGLNLTAADYVFVLDPWWNPAVEAQAIDRAHRIGQTRKVMAYRVIAKDTIEERVLELQARKRELTAALFEQKKGPLATLTREDIEFLFGAR